VPLSLLRGQYEATVEAFPVLIDGNASLPLEQTIAVVEAPSSNQGEAALFVDFLLGPGAQRELVLFGYTGIGANDQAEG
jgi:ABC-type molybdate transport system substrate-binding protein